MAGITESCSVCQAPFDVQFRYQMEERDGGFSFFCSQKCLETSQVQGSGQAAGSATCDACAKRFTPDLVSQVLYISGRRRYACSLGCRAQLVRESKGARLGDIAAAHVEARPADPRPVESTLKAGDTPTRDTPIPLVKMGDAPNPPVKMGDTPMPPVKMGDTPMPPVKTGDTPVPPASRPTQSRRVPEAATAVAATPPPRRAPSGVRPVDAPPSAAPANAAPATGVPRVVAVFNHKGGTGKTTTAVSIAAGLAAKGKKVLLVDTDAQGNVAVSLGAGSERSLYHVLVMGLRVADTVKEVRPNLDLLPSNETLAAAELYLAGRQNRDRVLHERLAAASAGYDFVVLDCSPSLSLMNQNALVFADSVLVPVACDYLSLVGVRQVIKTVKNVNALLHHPVHIWGVLPTFYDSRAKICREAVATLKQHFGDRCLAPVRAVMKVKEAPAQGQTIFEYAEDSNAAEDYAAVVQRIVASRQGELVFAPPRSSTEPTSTASPSSAIA